MSNTYSIRDLSHEFNVTTRTLRFYEEKGLLAPIRKGTTRVYSAADRASLKLVLRGKRLGLSLEESADLISMYDPQSSNKTQLRAAIGKFSEKRAKLVQQREELELMIGELTEYEKRYQKVLNGKAKTVN